MPAIRVLGRQRLADPWHPLANVAVSVNSICSMREPILKNKVKKEKEKEGEEQVRKTWD